MGDERKIKYYSQFKVLFTQEKREIDGETVVGYSIDTNKLDLFIKSDSLIGAYLEYGKHFSDFDKLIDL